MYIQHVTGIGADRNYESTTGSLTFDTETSLQRVGIPIIEDGDIDEDDGVRLTILLETNDMY